MAYHPNNPNGQATMANSAPVVIASDQTTLPVGGNVASAATDSGNPVKIGGKYNSTLPTFTDGQRGDLQIGTRGSLSVTLLLPNSTLTASYVATNADGVAASSTASRLETVSRNSVYNSATTQWDRTPGNATDGTLVNLGANNDVTVTSLTNGSLNGPGAPTIDSYTSASVSAAANTADQSLVSAPGANKQIWVYGLVGSADTGDGSISLQDEDNTAKSGIMEVTRRGGFVVNPSGNFAMPWFKVATNKALEIDTVTCGFKGTISYAIVSV